MAVFLSILVWVFFVDSVFMHWKSVFRFFGEIFSIICDVCGKYECYKKIEGGSFCFCSLERSEEMLKHLAQWNRYSYILLKFAML